MELRKIKKNGGSYFVGIPGELVKWFGFSAGDYVKVEKVNNKILITPEYDRTARSVGNVEPNNTMDGGK